MAKLPKIYHKDINKNISNNKEYTYIEKKTTHSLKTNETTEEIINSLFKENGFIFNKPIIIKTKDKIYDTAIIKKTASKVYTLTEDIINIKDIISIERK
ncbi:MAG: hypothetical protein IKO49_04155 [Bacilli bacterium]|nr:hypothetical protein [Bacilli bacterium]